MNSIYAIFYVLVALVGSLILTWKRLGRIFTKKSYHGAPSYFILYLIANVLGQFFSGLLYLKAAGVRDSMPVFALVLAFCSLYALLEGYEKNPYRAEIPEGNEAVIPWIGTVFTGLLFILPAEGILAGILLTILAYVFVSFGLLLSENLTKRHRLEKEIMELERIRKESRDYMNVIRAQRHDLNLHLHAISGLIAAGDYTHCGEYVNRLVRDSGEINEIMPVYDMVVGSMLYNMRQAARKKGTDIHYEITYDMQDVLCSGFELNKVIGNLLQNAIDAVNTEEEKAYGIHASIFKRGGSTIFTVANRFNGDSALLERIFDVGFSTKKRHEGIGLITVRSILDSRGGSIYPEIRGDVLTFYAIIPNRFDPEHQKGENIGR